MSKHSQSAGQPSLSPALWSRNDVCWDLSVFTHHPGSLSRSEPSLDPKTVLLPVHQTPLACGEKAKYSGSMVFGILFPVACLGLSVIIRLPLRAFFRTAQPPCSETGRSPTAHRQQLRHSLLPYTISRHVR